LSKQSTKGPLIPSPRRLVRTKSARAPRPADKRSLAIRRFFATISRRTPSPRLSASTCWTGLRTGAFEAFEIFARWHHPTRGLVMPLDFIPFVERYRLMNKLSTCPPHTVIHRGEDHPKHCRLIRQHLSMSTPRPRASHISMPVTSRFSPLSNSANGNRNRGRGYSHYP